MKLISNNIDLILLRGVAHGRTLRYFGIDVGVMAVPNMLIAGNNQLSMYSYMRYRQLKSECEVEK
jgi:hypothetical protein